MLSKSALAGGGQIRWLPLEAFLGLYRGIFSERFFFFFLNLPIGVENASGAFWGWKMVSGRKKSPPTFWTYGPSWPHWSPMERQAPEVKVRRPRTLLLVDRLSDAGEFVQPLNLECICIDSRGAHLRLADDPWTSWARAAGNAPTPVCGCATVWLPLWHNCRTKTQPDQAPRYSSNWWNLTCSTGRLEKGSMTLYTRWRSLLHSTPGTR